MPETKTLITKTEVLIIEATIRIKAYYETVVSSANTILAFISDIVQTFDGIHLIEGELAIQMNENYPSKIDYQIDSNGDLIVSSDDANSYSVDSNGDLIYNEA
jgi:hypothetical protein